LSHPTVSMCVVDIWFWRC